MCLLHTNPLGKQPRSRHNRGFAIPRRQATAAMHHPTRRRFLHASLLLGAAPLAGCGPQLRDVRPDGLPAALHEIQRLSRASALHASTAWSWSKTLVHLAQSVEYSMTGYPQMHSALFQTALGQPAFAFFRWRGHMQHDLTAPIPGSPAIADKPALQPALLRLAMACQHFMQWQGTLQPHFAYGDLSHAEYEQAHAMHLANHAAAFDVQG